ncbi:MAG: ABC transporter permease subunit [Candidatus Izimaplasma sp.]|nr:ABC transporter permease subunit [Candidatus Izimaplasma bacterium]
MRKLLKYDFYYLLKTSKFIVFPVLLVLLAIISPLTARYLNEILAYTLEGTGIVIDLGTPTVIESYSQYIGNLYELYLYVIIFVAIGMFINDKTKGLLPLILSKPISRTKYILSKYISISVLILVSLIIGCFVFDYYTYYLFDEIDMVGMFYVTLLYFVYIIYVLSITLFSATYTKSYVLALVTSLGIMLFFGALRLWEVGILKYIPGYIINNMIEVLSEVAEPKTIILNVLLTLAISSGFIILSIFKFRNQDI